MRVTDKDTAISIFTEAVKAVQPSALIPAHIKFEDDALIISGERMAVKDHDGILILSLGKAASAMALEAEKILGQSITAGLVVTKYNHSLRLAYCRIIEAGHPVPDENSLAAARAILAFLQQLTAKSLLLCFISGGASALVADVAGGVTLEDLQAISNLLLQCGANIQEINTVRKHISVLKGGQMVRLTNGCHVFSLIISDVPGDDTSIIASGLTVADPTTYRDALQVLEKYTILDKAPTSIRTHLSNGIENAIPETPKPGTLIFNKVRNYIIGNNGIALKAATLHAESLGFTAVRAKNALHGEARIAAAAFVDLLLRYNGPKPACLLAGGETTVTIKGKGKGGRNQEFVLAALGELMDKNVPPERWPVILSAGTDGTDGPTEAAGAVIDIKIYLHINKMELNLENFLTNNDSFHFFEPLGSLIVTGATQTNVMDIVIALIK